MAGTLFHYLVAKDEAMESFQRQLAGVQSFLNDRHLPNHLKQRVLQYVDFRFVKSRDKYVESVDLPKSLELRVASAQYKSVLDTNMGSGAPLRGCNEQFMSHLLISLHEVIVPRLVRGLPVVLPSPSHFHPSYISMLMELFCMRSPSMDCFSIRYI